MKNSLLTVLLVYVIADIFCKPILLPDNFYSLPADDHIVYRVESVLNETYTSQDGVYRSVLYELSTENEKHLAHQVRRLITEGDLTLRKGDVFKMIPSAKGPMGSEPILVVEKE